MQSELLCLLVQIIDLKKSTRLLTHVVVVHIIFGIPLKVYRTILCIFHTTLGYDIQESGVKYS
jgi:hypothetical protein